jgi:ketosteroid isomerase-like protein
LLAAGFVRAGDIRPIPYTLSQKQPDDKLRQQVQKLADALNHRDLAAIRAQIHPTRIYVEVDDKAAYLSHSQTLVVMETFFKNRSSVTSTFDFVSDDGVTGSASGTLSARKDGKPVRYRLNFGFTKNDAGAWLLTRISMR